MKNIHISPSFDYKENKAGRSNRKYVYYNFNRSNKVQNTTEANSVQTCV